MSVGVVDMPILQRHSRKLPPLEDEDTLDDARAHRTVCKPKPVRKQTSLVDLESNEAVKSMVQEVASVILTARPCGWQSSSDRTDNGHDSHCGQPGIPASIHLSQKIRHRLLAEVEDIWMSQGSVYIEVHGQAGEVERGGMACADSSLSSADSSLSSADSSLSSADSSLSSADSSLSSADSSLSSITSLTHCTAAQSTGCTSRSSMLLEMWSIQVVNTTRCVNTSLPASSTVAERSPTLSATPISRATPTSGVAAPLLIQAVQSHLHFSQIRSWQEMGMHSHTHLPFQLMYNMRRGATIFDSVMSKPHTFPVTMLTGNTYVQVVVWSLPRLDSIPHQLHSHSTINSLSHQLHSNSTINSMPHQLHSNSAINSVQLHSHSTIGSVRQQQFPGQTVQVVDDMKPSSESLQETFPFSPPTPSPLSPKLLAGLADNSLSLTHVSTTTRILDSTRIGLPIGRTGHPIIPTRPDTTQDIHYRDPAPQDIHYRDPVPQDTHYRDPAPQDIHYRDPVPQDTHYRDLAPQDTHYRDLAPQDIHYRDLAPQDIHYRDTIQCRSETLYQDIPVVNQHHTEIAASLGAIDNITKGLNSFQLSQEKNGTSKLAPFEPAPRAPGSPAPFSTMYTGSKSVKRRSCALTCKRQSTGTRRVQRCNSAPVNVSSLCLLGTFEESILNSRLEACGHVEGFMAELAASGSFCPPHLALPVTAAFYSLHDNHRGTSPYLGQVDLSEVGKRGYQVPRKGTVQMTLFNPNHTVVKIYIVPYDFSDMPPSSQTFLRQKTLSYPSPASSTAVSSTSSGRQMEGCGSPAGFPSLHYLIHLRFLCSKSRRIYLHRDIRMLFAHRAPDTEPGDSHVTLHTVTDGPEEPKYSPSVPA